MKKLLILLLICQSVKGIPITNFGAVGDGATDNYWAFKQASIYAAANPNTTITIPSGTFYIAKYRTVQSDTVDQIKWDHCRGLKIIGVVGSVISMNGNFFRRLDYVTPESCAKKSYTTGISPFYFYYCDTLEIRGIEITGNVQLTTRAAGMDVNNPSVTEGRQTLLFFEKCDSVLVDSMYLHHAEADGITISGDMVGGVWVNSRRFNIRNTRSENNGRQGMSIGGLDTGYFYKCRFRYIGFTGGTYGHNDPAAGIDIEPGANHYAKKMTFDSCYFIGNYGAAFICSYPETDTSITLLKCIVDSMGTEKPQGMTMLASFSLIDSCVLKFGSRSLKITNSSKPGSTIGIRNSIIQSTGTWVNTSSISLLDSIIISNNQIQFTSNTMSSAFIQLKAIQVSFLNNTVSASVTALDSKPSGSHVFIQNAIISQGNIFSFGMRVNYDGTITVSDP